jgi:hypothetical protein
VERNTVRSNSVRPIILVILVFTAAFAQRVGQLIYSPDCAWPHSAFYEGDATLNAHFAQSLQRGTPFEYDLPIHSPGVAYLLSWMWDGQPATGLTVVKIFWCVCGSLSCAILFVILLRWCSEMVACLASMLAAASFALTVQCCSLNADAPYTVLLMASLLLVLQFKSDPSKTAVALIGLVSGLAVLFRPEHTLLVLIFAAYLAIQARRRRVYLLILAATFFIVPLPWNMRSYRAIERFNTVEPTPIDYSLSEVSWSAEAFDYLRKLPAFVREPNFKYISYLAQMRGVMVDRAMLERFFVTEMGYYPRPLSPFVFVSNQGPLSFALANCAQADGGFSTALLDDASAVGVFSFANPRHLRLYQDGFGVGLMWMRDHPSDALRLMVRKLSIFASGLVGGMTAWNTPLSPGGLRRAADQVATPIGERPIWSAALLLLAAIGMALSRKSDLGRIFAIVVLYKLLVTLAFYGYARQSASILPIFYYFLAVGLAGLLTKIKPLVALGRRPFMHWTLPVAMWLVVIGSAILFAARPVRYDIAGPIDAAEQWGPGAFESQRALQVRLLR